MYDEDREESEIDKEFELAINGDHYSEIQERLDAARTALREAVVLSEKYGLPFIRGISFISNGYIPKSFREKWKDVDRDLVSEIAFYDSDFSDDGWQHSAVC